ncbi:MAG: hypothetical protein ACKKMS_00110 [Candidatus Nealsonbacteria bacterium]
MATFVWQLQGTTPTTIIDTDKLQFANGVFDGKITVGEYNESTHVKDVGEADKSAENTPRNVKYISSAKADWGDGEENLVDIIEAECSLKIKFSDTGVITEDAIFYAYDGTTPATPPVNVTIYGAELGDTDWTAIAGSGSALALDAQEAADDHDFFIPVSASPDTVGAKTGKVRIELTYS